MAYFQAMERLEMKLNTFKLKKVHRQIQQKLTLILLFPCISSSANNYLNNFRHDLVVARSRSTIYNNNDNKLATARERIHR